MKKLTAVTPAALLGLTSLAIAAGKPARISTQGATLISGSKCLVERLVVDSVASSSSTVVVSVYDSATVAGITSSNLVMTLTLPVTATAQTATFGNILLNATFRNGCVISTPVSTTLTAAATVAPTN
jgi:hypothetical protein